MTKLKTCKWCKKEYVKDHVCKICHCSLKDIRFWQDSVHCFNCGLVFSESMRVKLAGGY